MERFVKAIRFMDVEAGDVVCLKDGEEFIIFKPSSLPAEAVALYYKQEETLKSLVGHADQVIGLVHRPWPEGKTEEDMLSDIDAAISISALENAVGVRVRGKIIKSKLAHIIKAIEAYELGKPLEPKP